MSVTALQIAPPRVAPAAAFSFTGFDAVAANDNEQLAILVGELRGELRGFREDMVEVKDALASAADSRGRLHEKVGLIDKRLETLEGTVTVMGGVVDKQTNRINKIEPLALYLLAAAGGLLLVGGALWYVVMSYGAAVLDWIITLRAKP